MLGLVSVGLTNGTQKYRRAGVTSLGNAFALRTVHFVGVEPTADLWRSSFDSLWQGGEFDQFHNKYLHNRQAKGMLYSVPIFDGSDGTGHGAMLSGRYASQGWIDGETASVKIGSYWYTIQNQGDTSVYYWSVHTGRIRYFDMYRTCCLSLNQADSTPAVLHLTVDFDMSSWTVRGIQCQVSSTSASGLSSYCDRTATETMLNAIPIPPDDLEEMELLQYYAPYFDRVAITWWHDCQLGFYNYIAVKGIPSASSLTIRNLHQQTIDRYLINDLIQTYKGLLPCADPDASELSLQARDTIENLNDFNSNLLAYASDLKKTGDTIRSLLHLAANWRSPKAWAAAWLSGHYGDRLAVKDTQELLLAVQRALTTRTIYAQGRTRRTYRKAATVGGRSTTVTCDYLQNVIAYNTSYDALSTTIGTLMRWDAWPTLENSWDMIPLSFLVDWFIPVSNLLAQIDAAVEAPYIRPASQYIGRARIVQFQLDASDGVRGTIELRDYSRNPHGILDDVRPFDVVTEPPSFSVVHAADAAALLIQTV